MLKHNAQNNRQMPSLGTLNRSGKPKRIIVSSDPLMNNFHDRQEWMRVRQAVRCFSIGRSSLYKLLSKGFVKSVSIKERGALRGIRLINADSVRNYLENLA